MTQEALKLALEALEKSTDNFPANVQHRKAITAIKEALAQPEQEPVAYTNGTDVILAKYWTADYPPKGWEPLGYTTPPHRKPLTDEEIEQRIGYRLPASGFDAIRQLIKENT